VGLGLEQANLETAPEILSGPGVGADVAPRNEMEAAVITGPVASTTARSIVFSSSRTFPGQS